MSTVIWVGLAALSAMMILLAIFSDDIVQGQRQVKENFISKRKSNLRKISLMSQEETVELIKATKKGFFTRRKEKTEHLILKADIKITYFEFIMVSLLFAIIGFIVGQFINNILISLLLVFIFFYFPRTYLNFVCDSIKKQIDEQIEPALSQIIGLLPTKKTLTNACETCVESMEEPIKTFFTEFINNINNANRSFEDALNELAKKIDSKPFYDFARLAIVNYKHGGDTMFAFSAIPETIRDIKLIQSEQETELDSLRLLGYIFTALAPLSYVYYYFTDKDSFEILVNSGIGKGISFVVLIIMILTIKIVKSISKPVEL